MLSLRALVPSSHHRPNRFALLQEQFGDCASYRANATRRAGNQNGICHVFRYALSEIEVRF
jgi:hypothetical protein